MRGRMEPARFRIGLAGRIGAWLLRALGATWRIRIEGIDPRPGSTSPHLGALWHRDLLVAGYIFRDSGISIPISQSRDGDLAAAIARPLGFAAPPRGSSSTGGTTILRELIKWLDEGGTAAIVVDGPRGPALSSKSGIIALAGWSRTPITGLGFSARPCLRLASWDRTLVPLPFAQVTCRFGSPLVVAKAKEPETREADRLGLELQLNRMTRELDQAAGPTEKDPA